MIACYNAFSRGQQLWSTTWLFFFQNTMILSGFLAPLLPAFSLSARTPTPGEIWAVLWCLVAPANNFKKQKGRLNHVPPEDVTPPAVAVRIRAFLAS